MFLRIGLTKNLIVLVKLYCLIYFISFNYSFAHDCLNMDVAKSILENDSQKPLSILNQDVTLEEAYCAQEKLNFLINKKFNDKVGYKVGFTSKDLQKRFNINSPATGVLYKHMFLDNNSYIDHKFAYRPFIEPDILVIIKSSGYNECKELFRDNPEY